jgi:hypothetical protein
LASKKYLTLKGRHGGGDRTMKDWRVKCVTIARHIKENADVLLDLSKAIHNSASLIYSGASDLDQDEAREVHLKYASLLDQLDDAIPKINTLARVARSRRGQTDRLERERSVQG